MHKHLRNRRSYVYGSHRLATAARLWVLGLAELAGAIARQLDEDPAWADVERALWACAEELRRVC